MKRFGGMNGSLSKWVPKHAPGYYSVAQRRRLRREGRIPPPKNSAVAKKERDDVGQYMKAAMEKEAAL